MYVFLCGRTLRPQFCVRIGQFVNLCGLRNMVGKTHEKVLWSWHVCPLPETWNIGPEDKLSLQAGGFPLTLLMAGGVHHFLRGPRSPKDRTDPKLEDATLQLNASSDWCAGRCSVSPCFDWLELRGPKPIGSTMFLAGSTWCFHLPFHWTPLMRAGNVEASQSIG